MAHGALFGKFSMDESICKHLKKVAIANNAQCRVGEKKCSVLCIADDVVVCGRSAETVQRIQVRRMTSLVSSG